MDDCGAILHNIETKWLYDFLTPKNAAIFPVRQSVATSRNRHSAAASVRWNRRLVLNCLTAGNAAATLRTRENLPFADPPSVATVREQSGRAAWRQRLRATKNQDSRCTLSFPRAVTVHYQPDAAALYGQLKLLMSMKRSINCVKGKVTVFFLSRRRFAGSAV